MMPKSQAVYFLFSSQQPHFKIGISVDAYSRAKTLAEEIDFSKSFCVECSALPAKRIEYTLHSLFKKYQIKQHKRDGYPEWFSAECWTEVYQFIKSYQKLLGCSDFKNIPIPKKNATAPKVRRRKTHEEILELEREAFQETNQQALYIQNFVSSSVQTGACLGKVYLKDDEVIFREGELQKVFVTKEYLVFLRTAAYLEWRKGCRLVGFYGYQRGYNFYSMHAIFYEEFNCEVIRFEPNFDFEELAKKSLYRRLPNLECLVELENRLHSVPYITNTEIIEKIEAHPN